MKRNRTHYKDRTPNRSTKKKQLDTKRSPHGRRVQNPAAGGLFRSWLSNHFDIAISSLMRLLSAPMQTLLTILVVAVAICTPMLVYSFAQSIQASVARLDATTDISVYLDTAVSRTEVNDVQEAVEAFQEVETVTYISPEQGLSDFEDRTGLSEILSHLDDNPIPAVFTVSVKSAFTRDTEVLSKLAAALEEIRGVDTVVFDYAWVERLQALIDFMNRLTFVLGALLGGGIALILGNTIRLEIENRRDEIVIVKLVGGTNAFVRRPLLYAGFWYGFMGALVGWVLANFGVAALDQPLGDLSRLYISDFGLGFLNLIVLAIVLVIGALLGLAGAWLAVSRHLSEIEPR